MSEDAKRPDPGLVPKLVVPAALAAGLLGVIGGLALACQSNASHTREVASAGYSGAAIFLGGCACIIAVLRTVRG